MNDTVITIIIIAFIIIPAILLFVGARTLSATRWGNAIPLRWSPVLLHTAIMLVLIGLYPTGWFIPGIPFDDVYMAYYCIPGLHIYFPSALAAHHFFPWLLLHLGDEAASIITIVILPGVAGIILGGLQWFIIGLIMEKTRTANKCMERIA